jgi:putative hydrolase of HD superfamily
MTTEHPTRFLDFLRAAGALKDVERNSWTGRGRRESAAEHTWRLCLMAVVLEGELEGVDLLKLLKLLIVHDLGEVVRGDVPAPLQTGDKGPEERADFLSLTGSLPEDVAARLVALWDEYDRAKTKEARLAKGLDKLETCLQHVEGANPPDFDYAFNLGYGRRWDGVHPLLDALRAEVDAETARLARGTPEGPDSA